MRRNNSRTQARAQIIRGISSGLVAGLLWLSLSHHAIAGAGVASADPLATEAGIEILNSGGNAFDAAIAVSAVLAVVEPAGSGFGGGGFWLLHDATKSKDIMVDGREKAPLAATRDMYLDQDGNVIKNLSINGALAAGIPGQPAALVWIAENYGALPLATSLRPAIQLAQQGFHVDERYQRLINFRLDTVNASPEAAKIFLVNGEAPALGAVIKQPDLAKTLEQIAAKGHAGFYQGSVANKLVKGVRAAGGIWTQEDLSSYQIKLRKPITAKYRDMKITSAALPSSGGLVLAQALNILSYFDLDSVDKSHAHATAGKSNADAIHLTVEAMRRAYHDRAEYMGDSDFVKVPIKKLTARNYAKRKKKSIRLESATPNQQLNSQRRKRKSNQYSSEGVNTSHFSVIDANGNRVAATLSLNYPFGSGVVPPGTGILLNDQMDDFSAKPGKPNVYGLVGGDANAIEGGKRMLSSMSPTFLETNDRIAVLGTPGGSRIISMVLLAAMEFQHGANAKQMVQLPRFHHQYLPDAIQYEPDALAPQIIEDLIARGHNMDAKNRTWGNMHVVIQDKSTGKINAASDPRGKGVGMVLQ